MMVISGVSSQPRSKRRCRALYVHTNDPRWKGRSVNDLGPIELESQLALVPSEIRIRLPGPQYALDYGSGRFHSGKVGLHLASQFPVCQTEPDFFFLEFHGRRTNVRDPVARQQFVAQRNDVEVWLRVHCH